MSGRGTRFERSGRNYTHYIRAESRTSTMTSAAAATTTMSAITVTAAMYVDARLAAG
jgi:hypothetical protein